jgi:hypothetical protein
MKLKLFLTACVVASASPGLANPPSDSERPAHPRCTEMPDRNGHFWAEDDWCRWLAEFENNRDWQGRKSDNKR